MIYMDNAASRLGNYNNFNANSAYATERQQNIEHAREQIAYVLNCSPNEIYFTSGGCESNSWALQRIKTDKKHIITTKIEHKSILNCCKYLEEHGYEVTYLDVEEDGHVHLSDISKNIRPDTFLISIMHVNNEIGCIQPIEEIGKIAHRYGVYFHVDAVQSIGNIDIDVEKCYIDLLSASGHKFAVNNGVGFLYCSERVPLEPLIFGGSQERGIRGGTTNYNPIIRMANALIIKHKNEITREYIRDLIKYFREELGKLPYDIRINTPISDETNILSVSFANVDAESLMMFLLDFDILVSAGSACNTDTKSVSHVLKAIKVPDEYINGTIRFSLSEFNTISQINAVVKIIDNYLKYGAK